MQCSLRPFLPPLSCQIKFTSQTGRIPNQKFAFSQHSWQHPWNAPACDLCGRTSTECVCLPQFTPHKHFQHCPACHRTKEERKSESQEYGWGEIHLPGWLVWVKGMEGTRVKHTIKALEIKEFREQALHSNFSFRTTGGSCFSSQQEVPFLSQRLPLHILPNSFSLPSPEQPTAAAQLVSPSSSFPAFPKHSQAPRKAAEDHTHIPTSLQAEATQVTSTCWARKEGGAERRQICRL